LALSMTLEPSGPHSAPCPCCHVSPRGAASQCQSLLCLLFWTSSAPQCQLGQSTSSSRATGSILAPTDLSGCHHRRSPASTRRLSPSRGPSSCHHITPYPPHHLVDGFVEGHVLRAVLHLAQQLRAHHALLTQESLQLLHHVAALGRETEDLLDAEPHQPLHPGQDDARLRVQPLLELELQLLLPPALLPEVALPGLPGSLLIGCQLAQILPLHLCRQISNYNDGHRGLVVGSLSNGVQSDCL